MFFFVPHHMIHNKIDETVEHKKTFWIVEDNMISQHHIHPSDLYSTTKPIVFDSYSPMVFSKKCTHPQIRLSMPWEQNIISRTWWSSLGLDQPIQNLETNCWYTVSSYHQNLFVVIHPFTTKAYLVEVRRSIRLGHLISRCSRYFLEERLSTWLCNCFRTTHGRFGHRSIHTKLRW